MYNSILFKRFHYIILIFINLGFQIACFNVNYTSQYFTFPPGTKAHESGWEYVGIVTTESLASTVDRSLKTVSVKIYDKAKNVLLDEKFKFVCASVRAIIIWDTFEHLNIDLKEVGNNYAEDSYNKRLIDTGPNILINLKYSYDLSLKKFVREGQT